MNLLNIPGYIGITCFVIVGALKAYTALTEHRARRQVTDLAPCAGCGNNIQLRDRHVTINRHVEYMDSARSATVLDAETTAHYHLGCAS